MTLSEDGFNADSFTEADDEQVCGTLTENFAV